MATYIGETNDDYINGQSYPIMRRPMTGTIYKPGKDENGKWLDTVGKPDTRIMLWKDIYGTEAKMGYRVYESQEAIEKDFQF